MKILITGGAGFVGSAITRHFLTFGWDVNVLDVLWFDQNVPNLFKQCPGYSFLKGSISDEDSLKKSLEGVDYVIHAAAVVGDPASKKYPELTQKTNYEGSLNLIKHVSRSSAKGLVFLSTCSNYGIADGIANEGTVLKPLSAYSETKVNVERHLMDKTKDLDWVICRLSTVYGASSRMRFDLTVNDFAAHGYIDKKLEVFLPLTFRPYIHVQDVAQTMFAVINNFAKVRKNVFNVGFNTENYQKIKIAEIVRSHLPDLNIITVSSGVDARDYQVDFSKLKNMLGVQRRWDVSLGVKEVLDLLRRGEIRDINEAKFYNTNPNL